MASLSSFNDSFLPGDSFVNTSGPISSLPAKYTSNCVKVCKIYFSKYHKKI